ncbi:hypothetical protein ASD34_24330 [Variovorax sp. Root473]|nr:hypothetical protein ASD34_24330 [Variovorax sp. Root473]
MADLTYIWTAEGWLYAAAVLDLYSRGIVGWSMQGSMNSQLVADALMMAVWRRGKPLRCCITTIKEAKADSTGRRNTSIMEVFMSRPPRWMQQPTVPRLVPRFSLGCQQISSEVLAR